MEKPVLSIWRATEDTVQMLNVETRFCMPYMVRADQLYTSTWKKQNLLSAHTVIGRREKKNAGPWC